jgi:hypothetical protein
MQTDDSGRHDTGDPAFWNDWDDWHDPKDRISATFLGWDGLSAIERCLVAHASAHETLGDAIGYYCGHPDGDNQNDWMFRDDDDRIRALVPDFARAVMRLAATGHIVVYVLPSQGTAVAVSAGRPPDAGKMPVLPEGRLGRQYCYGA